MIEDLGVIDTRKIISVVQELHKIDFSNDALTALRYRFVYAINALQVKNADELCLKLKNKDFLESFLEKTSVECTEFFRDPSFWRELRKLVFAKIEQKGKFSIWFPDCASGEELYSLAIFLKEDGLLNKVTIIASQQSVRKNDFIREGIYSLGREDINSANYKRANGVNSFTDYTQINGKKFQIDKNLIDRVEFKTFNSVTEAKITDVDLVMYRNSLIYYNKSAQNDIVEYLYTVLAPNGYLAIGIKETLNILSSETKFRELHKGECIYQKIAR